MDEKSDIDIGFNKNIVQKNKQGTYGSKDSLHNLELFTDLLGPKFVVASFIISSCNGKTVSRNQTKHQYIQEVIVHDIAKMKEAPIRCTQYDFMDVFMMPTIQDKNSSHLVLVGITIYFYTVRLTLKNICLWLYCVNKRCDEVDQVRGIWLQSFFSHDVLSFAQ